MRPVPKEEALAIDITAIDTNGLDLANLIKRAYILAENVQNTELKETILLSLREILVFDKRIRTKMKEYTPKIYINEIKASDEEIRRADMEATHPKWTLCETIRDCWRTCKKVEEPIRSQIQILLQEASLYATRLVDELKKYRNLHGDASLMPEMEGLSWVKKE